jgi:hypothetical protein
VSTVLGQSVFWCVLCGVLLWLYVSPLLLQDSFFQMNTDEANYVWKAEQISRDVSILANERAWRRHPPLIPTIVGLLAKVTSLQLAVLITTKAFAIIGIVMVFVAGVQLKNPIAGLIASVLLAADPTFRGLSNKLMLDIPLMTLFVVCASLLLKGGRYRMWAVGTGILALFVKDYGILVLVYALAFIAWDALINRGVRPGKVIGIVFISLAVTLLPLGYYMGHVPPCCDWLPWLGWLERQLQLRIWRILDNSVGWMVPGIPRRYLGVTLLFVTPLVVRMLSRSTIRKNLVLAVWIGIILVPFLFAYTGDDRVILLFAPALYLTVGICCAQALDLVRTPAARRSAFGLMILGAVFVLILAQRNPSVLYYTSCRFRAYYPAGKWIGENVGRSNTVVFTRSSHQLRFYAKGDFERDGGMFFGHNEWTGVPISAAEFHNVLDGTDKDAYLVVDIEEKSDPAWLYPPNQAAAESIQSLGFQPVHLVWVPVGSLCDIPDSPYYAELPSFLKQLGIPLYRNSGPARERVDAVIFKRDRATAAITGQPARRAAGS